MSNLNIIINFQILNAVNYSYVLRVEQNILRFIFLLLLVVKLCEEAISPEMRFALSNEMGLRTGPWRC